MNRVGSNTLLRSEECWRRYQNAPKREQCFLCRPEEYCKIVKQTDWWFICENDYPYDNVCSTHHMLVPKVHVAHEAQLPEEYRHQWLKILWLLDKPDQHYDIAYDCVMRNFTIGQSHNSHLHYHLIVYKRVL